MIKLFIACLGWLSLLQSCTDGGPDSMSHAPMLLSDIQNKASCVFLTTDEKDNPAISWMETDRVGNKHFYFSYWDAESRTFSAGQAIPIEQHAGIHEEGMPKIAVRGDGTVFATYETNVPSGKSRFGLSDIRYVMSSDKGKTWTKPQSIQEVTPATGSRSFGNMIRLDDGEIGIAWLDTDTNGTYSGRPVRFARTNGDRGFEKSVLVDLAACECCRTALSVDGQGNIRIVFRDLLAGSVRDISASISSDNGKTFNTAIPFSGDNWKVDGCPHNGPSIASRNEKTYVTWFTGSGKSGVFYAELDANNNMRSKRRLNANGRFAQLCVMPDGSRIAAYDVQYERGDSVYSKIKISRIDEKGFFETAVNLPDSHASYPVVQAADERHVIIAWTDNGKIYYIQQDTVVIDDIAPEESFTLLSSYPAPFCGN